MSARDPNRSKAKNSSVPSRWQRMAQARTEGGVLNRQPRQFIGRYQEEATMRVKHSLSAMLLATALGTSVSLPAYAADITLFRFFGDCANANTGVTDMAKAGGECGIIQVLTNKFNAENKIGAKVTTQTVDWNAYYDLLSATYSTDNIPDVAVMHRSVLPNFASRNLLEPLSENFAKVGIDVADFAPAAKEAITVDGKVYALPFDIHALLLHINVDLMKQAGLVDGSGNPILPKSAAELIEQGKKFKSAKEMQENGVEPKGTTFVKVGRRPWNEP